MERITLYNGIELPMLGFGTFQITDHNECRRSVLSALKHGYRLIVAAWDSNDWTMSDIEHHYLTLCRYMHFENKGMVLGKGCGSVSMTNGTEFPDNAY